MSEATYSLHVWGYDKNNPPEEIIKVVQSGLDNSNRQDAIAQLQTIPWGELLYTDIPQKDYAFCEIVEDICKKCGCKCLIERSDDITWYEVCIRGYEDWQGEGDYDVDTRFNYSGWSLEQDKRGEIFEANKQLVETLSEIHNGEIKKETLYQLINGGKSVVISDCTLARAEKIKERCEAISPNYIISIHEMAKNIDSSAVASNNKKIDVSSANKMREYLKDVYTLEKEIYVAMQGKEATFNTIRYQGAMNRVASPNYEVMTLGQKLIDLAIPAAIASAISFLMFDGSVKLGMVLIGIVVGMIIIWHNSKKKNKVIDEFNEKTRKNEEIRKEQIRQLPQYEKKEKEFDKSIRSCKEALKELYGYDIIFPKYRNLVAISQIYEYFASGRVTELEGPNGAYNLFESELRQNIIIYELDAIRNQLENIHRYQRMTYDAIMESNQLLSNIEQNTAVTAFNSSVIAQNTSIMRKYGEVAIHNN